MPKPKKHHDVFRALLDHDPRFRIQEDRGKGSHYGIVHPDIDGQRRILVVPRHGGREVSPRILLQIIRRFNLPRDIFG